jgi:hypothetical protein
MCAVAWRYGTLDSPRHEGRRSPTRAYGYDYDYEGLREVAARYIYLNDVFVALRHVNQMVTL